MKVYAIAKTVNSRYGQGCYGDELAIVQYDGYEGKAHFKPMFSTWEAAEKYLTSAPYFTEHHNYIGHVVVEIEVEDENVCGTCRHWEPPYGEPKEGNPGQCTAEKVCGPENEWCPVDGCRGTDPYTGLMTGPKFGCKQHQGGPLINP